MDIGGFAVNRSIVVLIGCRTAENFYPVRTYPQRRRIGIIVILTSGDPVVSRLPRSIAEGSEFACIHQVESTFGNMDAGLGIEADRKTPHLFLGLGFGGNEYHAVGTSAAVNGRRGHILQHGNGLDIVRIDF